MFHLRLTGANETGTPGPKVTASKGNSLGRSADGSALVAILGTPDQDQIASQVADAYVARLRDPAACLAGNNGVVVIDNVPGAVDVIAAPIGLRQIFWRATDSDLEISSDPRTLSTPDGTPHALRPEGIFEYLYNHMLPGPRCIYRDVSKLDGGHAIRWRNGRISLRRFWHPRFASSSELDAPTAASSLLELLESAVNRAVQSSEQPGAFLSGGLDSTTVAGLASKLRPRIATVSMGFDASGYDEMHYARIASRHFQTTPLEYYVTPDDVFRTLPDVAAAFPEPFGNSSAAAAYHCARIAREHGIDLLLAGDGGDELFGGNARYAKQLIFERYRTIPASVRRRVLEPAVRVAGLMTTRFPIGKALRYIQQANVPLPDRLQSYNFLHRHAPEEIFSSALLETVDLSAPLRLLREEFDAPASADSLDRMLFLDWKFTLHDNDLVKVNTMCDLAGVSVAYPMLDQSVVDFSMQIPSHWKVRHGELRWFYKRAMRHFLPNEIIQKSKHGFGLPFGIWMRTHDGLRELAGDALASLGNRGYFRPEFLSESVRLHREGHASYYGELVWLLTALELWLQEHHPSAAL